MAEVDEVVDRQPNAFGVVRLNRRESRTGAESAADDHHRHPLGEVREIGRVRSRTQQDQPATSVAQKCSMGTDSRRSGRFAESSTSYPSPSAAG